MLQWLVSRLSVLRPAAKDGRARTNWPLGPRAKGKVEKVKREQKERRNSDSELRGRVRDQSCLRSDARCCGIVCVRKIALARAGKTPNDAGTRSLKEVCPETGVLTTAVTRFGTTVYAPRSQDESRTGLAQKLIREQLREGGISWLH